MSEETIYARIERRRRQLGLSARELERRAGLSQGLLKSLGQNPERSPRVDTVQKLAKALKVRFLWLAFGEGPVADADDDVKADAAEIADALLRLPEDERQAWLELFRKRTRRQAS